MLYAPEVEDLNGKDGLGSSVALDSNHTHFILGKKKEFI
jgi:hypothetical protein